MNRCLEKLIGLAGLIPAGGRAEECCTSLRLALKQFWSEGEGALGKGVTDEAMLDCFEKCISVVVSDGAAYAQKSNRILASLLPNVKAVVRDHGHAIASALKRAAEGDSIVSSFKELMIVPMKERYILQSISPLGNDFCLYKTQEDTNNICFIKVLRGV